MNTSAALRCDTVPFHRISLTPSLLASGSERGSEVLGHYYRPLSGKDVGFTGGAWDTFDPSGTRSAMVNSFTADDILSSSLLSAPIYGRAALELLTRRRRRFEVLLEDLGPDRDFVDVDEVDDQSFKPAYALWHALCELPGIGPTRASKLMARKRPRMIPIVDDVTRLHIFSAAPNTWAALHEALNANDRELHHRLLGLRRAAGLGLEVSALRVFDVLAWMDGTRNAERALKRETIQTEPVVLEGEEA